MKVGADETATKVRRPYKGEIENPSFKISPLAAKFDSKTAVQPQCSRRHFVAGYSGLGILSACAELNSKDYRRFLAHGDVANEAIALDRLWYVFIVDAGIFTCGFATDGSTADQN